MPLSLRGKKSRTQVVCAISQVAIPPAGRVVPLVGYGLICVFRIFTSDGDTEYWAISDLHITELARVKWAGNAWTEEHFLPCLTKCH